MPGRRCIKRVYKQTSLQKQINEAKRDRYCDYCNGGPLPPKYHLQFDRNLLRIFVVSGEDQDGRNVKEELTTKKIIDILTNISDENCRHLGFDPSSVRPEWMILTVLPIPPPNMRPSRKNREVDLLSNSNPSTKGYLISLLFGTRMIYPSRSPKY